MPYNNRMQLTAPRGRPEGRTDCGGRPRALRAPALQLIRVVSRTGQSVILAKQVLRKARNGLREDAVTRSDSLYLTVSEKPRNDEHGAGRGPPANCIALRRGGGCMQRGRG
jgi:hypothetical protein